ncbi:hypothetical protein, partial [Salmonella enterica]|uniref:hypothetical protein n=1 Tax=Salmonella enterica TaxID=28901 RepID=UPI003D298CF8
DRIVKANENIAIKSTKWFGSMAMFWACFIWAILPLFPALSGAKDFILYVSAGIIQLVALPLILVGSNVLNRASEARAEEDHK